MLTLSFEKKLFKAGFKIVAGADEVGRGAWAGPIVAAAVAFPPDSARMILGSLQGSSLKIDDSKKLTPRQREKAAAWIKENALAWGIGEVPASVINRVGMGKASRMAFRRAVAKTGAGFLLIDAFYLPYTRGLPVGRKNARKNPAGLDSRAKQLAIVNGDEKCFSIAAASIIAKVYRDKLMNSLSKQSGSAQRPFPQYKKYGWGRNKGYGTTEHQEAIKKYGATRLHRKQFIRSVLFSSQAP